MGAVATWFLAKLTDKGFDLVVDSIEKNKLQINKLFKEKISIVSKKIGKEFPDVLGSRVDYFFRQDPLVEELIKLLFVNQKVSIEVISLKFDDSTLPHDFLFRFIELLKIEINKEPIFANLLANKEIYITLNGIGKSIDDIVKSSDLQAKEITKILKLLENQFSSSFDIDNFLNNYRSVLDTNIKRINHIGLGVDPSIKKGKIKDLSAIFIPPNFILKSAYHLKEETKSGIKYDDDVNDYFEDIFEEANTVITFNSIFERPYNYVILGNPGAGKSLLLKSIQLYICGDNNIKIKNESIKSRVPFRIELKNYLSYKKQYAGNILKYISHSLECEYSIINILDSNLNKVFQTYESLVLFDGLDEIFDLNDKIEVKQDIENFHKLYKKVRSIVTSRFIGYNDAKLDEKSFCELSMLSFNSNQIKDYVHKWYLLEENDKTQREREISDFISKMSNVDNELLGNPLLLSLIVILYRNNLKIPESKLEIYQSCTHTLVDKWDSIKNLNIDLDKEILQKKEPIFSDLAYWQYEKLSSKEPNVTFYLAKKLVSESLVKKSLADDDNCESLAEAFLDYAQKRSIYFDNNFTHKTFLEYYTAYWLYSNIEKKHKTIERNKIISKYISNPFWTVVLELFLNLIDKDQPDTEILDQIITLNGKKLNSLPFLLYVVPNLKNISSIKVNDLIVRIIKYLLTTQGKSSKLSHSIIIRLRVWSENERLKRLLFKAFESIQLDDNDELAILLILQSEIMFYSNINNDDNRLLESFKLRVNFKEALHQNYYLYTCIYFHQAFILANCDNYFEITKNFIKNFGWESLFTQGPKLFSSFNFAPFFIYYWHCQIKSSNINNLSKNLKLFGDENLNLIIPFLLKFDFYDDIDENVSNISAQNFDNTTNIIEKKLYFLLMIDKFNIRHDKGFARMNFDLLECSKELKVLLKKAINIKNEKELLRVFDSIK